jgi:hypothetical protein
VVVGGAEVVGDGAGRGVGPAGCGRRISVQAHRASAAKNSGARGAGTVRVRRKSTSGPAR